MDETCDRYIQSALAWLERLDNMSHDPDQTHRYFGYAQVEAQIAIALALKDIAKEISAVNKWRRNG